MSDKWETVGKPAKVVKGKGNGAVSNNNKKGAVAKQMPKLEDVLPAGSLQAMYNAHDKVPEEKKPAAKPKNDAGKKPAKKDTPLPPKPKVPASLAEAVKMNVKLDDVKKMLENSQGLFPDSPILWLRDIAAYFNIKLVHEGSSEVGIFEGAPLSALSANVKKILYAIVQGLEPTMKEAYLETCISNTAHDIAKNLDTTGWKIMTQVVSDVAPSLVTSNLSRLVELRNSYQNRPAVCLAILWSVAQAGKKDLASGIRVWLDVMLPLLTMKHYTKFVVEYLVALLDQHTITADTLLAKPTMDLPNFITVQDTVFIVSGQINKEYGRQLREAYPRLQAAALAGARNHEIFPVLMDKLKTSNSPDQVLDCLEILSKCLVSTPAASVHWHKLYIYHLSESGQLLNYLADNWNRFRALGTEEFHETIEAFQDYNVTHSHKEEVGPCRDGCAAILAKISRSGGSWFPWKTLSFLLLIGTAAIINLDVQKNKTFKQSHTGTFLQDIGQYERVVTAYSRSNQLYLDSYAWSEKNIPVYYTKARTVAGPALDTAANCAQVAGAYVSVRGGEVYEVVKVKGGELGLHLQGAVEEIKARYPGLRDQAKVYLDVVVAGVKEGADRLVHTYQELVGGKISWAEVRETLLARLESAQTSLAAAFTAAKNHIQELVK